MNVDCQHSFVLFSIPNMFCPSDHPSVPSWKIIPCRRCYKSKYFSIKHCMCVSCVCTMKVLDFGWCANEGGMHHIHTISFFVLCIVILFFCTSLRNGLHFVLSISHLLFVVNFTTMYKWMVGFSFSATASVSSEAKQQFSACLTIGMHLYKLLLFEKTSAAN